MRSIVLTGGPCSGKTTVLRALTEEFGDRIVVVPEVATLLLAGGFPVPGKDVAWSAEWQAAFQAAVLPVQRSIEDACALVAKQRNVSLLVCDRGMVDGAGYTPGGIAVFCEQYGVDLASAFARYAAVIHLESLATFDPERYSNSGNDSRFEPLLRAQEIEQGIRVAWSAHPRRLIVDGRRGIEGKISEVIGAVRLLLVDP